MQDILIIGPQGGCCTFAGHTAPQSTFSWWIFLPSITLQISFSMFFRSLVFVWMYCMPLDAATLLKYHTTCRNWQDVFLQYRTSSPDMTSYIDYTYAIGIRISEIALNRINHVYCMCSMSLLDSRSPTGLVRFPYGLQSAIISKHFNHRTFKPIMRPVKSWSWLLEIHKTTIPIW